MCQRTEIRAALLRLLLAGALAVPASAQVTGSGNIVTNPTFADAGYD